MNNEHRPSLIVKVVTQKMVPFVIMLGCAIVLHGSNSPGGGFQGGVVIGAAYILFAIGIDCREARLRLPAFKIKMLESAGVLLFVSIGMAGLLAGYSFLANKAISFPPQGTPGSLLAGGALLGINIGIGMHVACTMVSLFYAFVEYDETRETETKKEHRTTC